MSYDAARKISRRNRKTVDLLKNNERERHIRSHEHDVCGQTKSQEHFLLQSKFHGMHNYEQGLRRASYQTLSPSSSIGSSNSVEDAKQSNNLILLSRRSPPISDHRQRTNPLRSETPLYGSVGQLSGRVANLQLEGPYSTSSCSTTPPRSTATTRESVTSSPSSIELETEDFLTDVDLDQDEVVLASGRGSPPPLLPVLDQPWYHRHRPTAPLASHLLQLSQCTPTCLSRSCACTDSSVRPAGDGGEDGENTVGQGNIPTPLVRPAGCSRTPLTNILNNAGLTQAGVTSMATVSPAPSPPRLVGSAGQIQLPGHDSDAPFLIKRSRANTDSSRFTTAEVGGLTCWSPVRLTANPSPSPPPYLKREPPDGAEKVWPAITKLVEEKGDIGEFWSRNQLWSSHDPRRPLTSGPAVCKPQPTITSAEHPAYHQLVHSECSAFLPVLSLKRDSNSNRRLNVGMGSNMNNPVGNSRSRSPSSPRCSAGLPSRSSQSQSGSIS